MILIRDNGVVWCLSGSLKGVEASSKLQGNSVAANRVALVLLWLAFYCTWTLFRPPLLDDADSVHAEVAREMLLRHDWVTLYANGIRYLEKAPLYYWMMAASMKVFGVSTAATRVPMAGSVLALTLLVEAFARRAFRAARAGLYAGLIALSSFGVFIFSRINLPDVLVCALLSWAVFCYWLTEQEDGPPTRHACWGFAAACALNLLSKGLIGIVFPVGIVGVHLLMMRGWRGGWARVRTLHPLSSATVFLAVAVPWHVLIALANPGHGDPGHLARLNGHWLVPYPSDGNVHGWAWFYFVNEQVYRYLNIRVPHDYDTSPLALFYGLIAVWLMPWSAMLPWAFARTPRERTRLLLALWAALPLLFFSLSTRQEYYVLPSLPPMMLLVASLLEQANAGEQAAMSLRRVSAVLLGAGLAGAACCVWLVAHTRTPPPGTDLAALLQRNPDDYALSFGHFLDLNGPALGLFRGPLALTALALLAGGVGHWALRRRGHPHAATLLLAGSAFAFLGAAHWGLATFAPVLSSYQLAETIAPQVRPEDLVAIHGEYEAGSTLGFYLRRNDLHIVEGRSSNLWYGSFFPDAPKIFETRESIAAKWAGTQRIFLWQDPGDRERPGLRLPGPVYVLARGGGKEILSNRMQ